MVVALLYSSTAYRSTRTHAVVRTVVVATRRLVPVDRYSIALYEYRTGTVLVPVRYSVRTGTYRYSVTSYEYRQYCGPSRYKVLYSYCTEY